MKILQVSSAFKPSFETGGVARSNYEISKELTKQGHDVTVYTTDRGSERVDAKKNQPVDVDGVRTYYFKNISNYLAMNQKIITPYYSTIVAKKEIKDFDLIHIHEHRTALALIVSHYARKFDVPYIVQPRGSAQKKRKTTMKTIFDLSFGYKILKNANKIILSSKKEYSLSKDILKKAKVDMDKISYLPNGLDSDFLDISKKKVKSFRSEYGIKENENIILYLGRITPRKGIKMLIDAFERLSNEEKGRNLNLVITGPKNSYVDKLKKSIKNKGLEGDVLFTGPLYQEDKIAAYESADIFVLPSKDEQESFGNVVLEASACGTPSVMTNVCGVSEWIENGISVNPNVDRIKEGVKKALDPEVEIGKKAKKEVIEEYSWKRIVKEKVIPIYEIILNRKRFL